MLGGGGWGCNLLNEGDGFVAFRTNAHAKRARRNGSRSLSVSPVRISLAASSPASGAKVTPECITATRQLSIKFRKMFRRNRNANHAVEGRGWLTRTASADHEKTKGTDPCAYNFAHENGGSVHLSAKIASVGIVQVSGDGKDRARYERKAIFVESPN